MLRRWQFWVSIIISIVFVGLALQGLDLTSTWNTLRDAEYLWLIPGTAVYFLGVAVRTWRWHFLLQPLKSISLRRLFPVVVIGYMGNNIYPARAGELLRAYVLKRREEISVSASLATVVVERIFDGIVMLLFIIVALSAVQVTTTLRLIIIGAGALFFTALIIFLLLAARPVAAARIYGFLVDHLLPKRLRTPIHGLLDRFIEGLASLRSFRHVLMIFLTSLVIWLLETVMYFIIMQAFPFKVSFMALMLMTGIVNLATILPALPGFIGTFDVPGIAVLTQLLGIERARATGFTLILHATLWLPITLAGIAFMARESLRWSDLARATDLKTQPPVAAAENLSGR